MGEIVAAPSKVQEDKNQKKVARKMVVTQEQIEVEDIDEVVPEKGRVNIRTNIID